MADPFRERRLNPAEARRVLRRAMEIAEKDPETAAAEKALTVDEIERGLAELGVARSSLVRALEGGEAARSKATETSWFLGAPTRIFFEEEVAGEPSEEDREDLLEEIRTAVGETGSSETVGRTFLWKLSTGNRGRELTVRLRARDGRTRILVEERLTRQATGLFVGLGVGGGVGPMGGYIGAIIALGVVGAIFPVLWIPLMLMLARTIFMALARRREEALRTLMSRLTKAAASWSRESSAVRVAASEGDGDAEAELEAFSSDSHRKARTARLE